MIALICLQNVENTIGFVVGMLNSHARGVDSESWLRNYYLG